MTTDTRIVVRMVVILLGAVLIPSASALERCSVRASKRDGTLLVDARSIVGQLRWGYDADRVTRPVFNPAECVAGARARKCVLGAVGTSERISASPDCGIHLRDDATSCFARVRGCVSPVGGVDTPDSMFAMMVRDIACPSRTVPCYRAIGVSVSEHFCYVGGFEFGALEDAHGRAHKMAECRPCDHGDEWCCGGLTGGISGARFINLVAICGDRGLIDGPTGPFSLVGDEVP